MHELPLVFFTVLTQSAVGAFVILLMANQLGHIDSRRLAIGLFGSMCVFGLGQLIGVFHLGQPFRAVNMLMGIGRSPMSNEIILSGLFAAAGGVSALGLLLEKGPQHHLRMLAYIAGAIGIAFIAVIPTVYHLETVANWNNGYAWLQMILTVVVCGGLLAASFGAVMMGAMVSIGAILVSLVFHPGMMATLQQTGGQLAQAQTTWVMGQLVFLAVGLLVCILTAAKKSTPALLYTGAVTVIAAELMGRIAFYNLWSVPM